MKTSQNYTARELKRKCFEGQEDRYLFNSVKPSAVKNSTDVGVHTLMLDQVPSDWTQDDLRRKLGGHHLISLELETNNVENINTGKGKIIFRSNQDHEKETIQSSLRLH